MANTGWLPIEMFCRHCGGKLDARAIPPPNKYDAKNLQRFPFLEYRHRRTKSKPCPVTIRADVYDRFKAASQYKKQGGKRWKKPTKRQMMLARLRLMNLDDE